MSDSNTLRARLRTPHHSLSTQSFIMHEAADEIERLTRELAEARDKALEEAAKVAERFGPDRPLAERRPSERIRGRWEGEQAASAAIAAAIRTLKEKT